MCSLFVVIYGVYDNITIIFFSKKNRKKIRYIDLFSKNREKCFRYLYFSWYQIPKKYGKDFPPKRTRHSVKLLLYCLLPPLGSCCSMMPPLSKPEFAWYYSHPHPHPHPQDISPKILAFIFFFNKNNNNNKRNKVSIY